PLRRIGFLPDPFLHRDLPLDSLIPVPCLSLLRFSEMRQALVRNVGRSAMRLILGLSGFSGRFVSCTWHFNNRKCRLIDCFTGSRINLEGDAQGYYSMGAINLKI